MSNSKPLLLTMGDACGIGPEIAVAAWAAEAREGALCVVGNVAVMRRAVLFLGLTLPVAHLGSVDELSSVPPHCLPVWQPDDLPAHLIEASVGQISAVAGAAAAACITAAVQAIQAGRASALVTAPIHKEALHAAGVAFPGHTELLQALAGHPPVRMMLANNELRTVLVTIHCSLRQAIEQINMPIVLETIRISHHALQAMGIAHPRIAVAGLNPHAGEGGLFGDEELLHIAPAIAAARAEGIDAFGPFAPDTRPPIPASSMWWWR